MSHTSHDSLHPIQIMELGMNPNHVSDILWIILYLVIPCYSLIKRLHQAKSNSEEFKNGFNGLEMVEYLEKTYLWE